MENDKEYVRKLSKKLVDGINSRIPHIIFNGDME
jgi:hypothetical protein